MWHKGYGYPWTFSSNINLVPEYCALYNCVLRTGTHSDTVNSHESKFVELLSGAKNNVR